MRGLAFVALVLVAVSAGPAPSNSGKASSCAGYCKGSSKYHYEVGTTYSYKYTADTVTSVAGAGSEESVLHFSANVELHVVSPCDFTMQMHNVNLSDSSPSAMVHLLEFQSAVEQNPLLFSFHEGRVDDLCVTSTDLPWVLNIKRGVLSAFQNSMKDLYTGHKLFETDVTGDCETEYSVRSSGQDFSIVDKRKNLLTCAHRLDHFLSLQSSQFMPQSAAQSLPLVKSDHHCVQTFEKGLLTQAVCKENHLFQPFSNGDNGAVTKVVQNMEYIHHSKDRRPAETGDVKSRTTLLFEHIVESTERKAQAQTITKILEDLERTTKLGVESNVPKLFAQLLAMLKSSSYPTLAKVFSRTKHQHTRKFLLDAMPLVGTPDGLTVMVDLYKSSEITDREMDSWLTSLTFLKKPTITMLLAVSSLLDGDPRPKAVLGLSSLVHSYCQTDSDCHEKETVQNYLSKLEKLLGDGCHVKGRQDMELKILALKGIGNMGILPTSLNIIAQCYLNSENPLEVRLAAIGAHRRLPCTENWVPNLLQTYTNMKLDTEIRIASYIAVMRCPSSAILAKVKETLYSEEVNQVASFVWTHLTNIQETSNRWKQSIKDLLTSDFLQKKFQTDVRKFSRNYEGSVFLDSLNAGIAVDSNIVFTPQSYLPRSASLNLTLDIFGESINVFEIGSRAEGFELIVENMFGPGGYFPDKSLKKVLQNAREKHEDSDLENSINQLGQIFNSQNKLIAEPQASVYARVFGNEIHYSRYQGIEELMNGQFDGNNLLAAFSEIFGRGNDVDYINSFVFLDASYRFPTVVGLPLELSVNGSATVGLKVSGQFDLLRAPIKVIGKIAPSAAVQVVGTMAVDGVVTKAGLRSVSTLHSNTYLEGHATIRGKSLVDIKLSVPREKMEILEVTSKMYVLRQEGYQLVEGILENREEYNSCSSEIASYITGMKLCTEVVYPNASQNDMAPYFPLTGPTTLQFNLVKTDSFKSYELNFQQFVQADGDVRSMKFQFDTPNSQVNRKILASFSLDKKNAAVKGNLETPFIKLDANGKIDYSENSKAMDLSLHMNDKNLFSTKAVVKTSHKGNLNRYEPTLSVVIHNVVDMRLTGKLNYIEDTKYSADFELAGLTKTPLLFSADLNCGDNKYDMIGSVHSPIVDGTIHTNLRLTNSLVNSKVTVEYSLHQAKTESVNLFFKIQSGYKRAIQKNSLFGSLQMSEMPQYNLLVHLDRMTSDNYAEYNGRFGLGKTEWHTKQMYRFHARGRDNIDFALISHLGCPSKNVDYKVSLVHKTTEFSLSTHVLVQLNAQHKFHSALDYQHLDEKQELLAEFSTPWRIATLRGEMVEREPGHFNTHLNAHYEVVGSQDVFTAQSLTMLSTFIDASTDTQQDLKVSVNLSGVCTATLTGELVTSDNFRSGWAHLDLLENKYRTNVTYSMDSQGQHTVDASVLLLNRMYKSQVIALNTDKKTEFSIDLDLSKHLFLSTKTLNEGIIRGVEFELLWDKDIDPSRRIALVAHTNNVKREALLQFPGQYIKAELITLPKHISGLLEWTNKQKIAMNMEWNIEQNRISGTALVTTPFPGILSQGASVTYKRNTTVTQIQTELSWQDEKISLNAVGTYAKNVPNQNDKSAATAVYEVEAEVTSTIQHIHDLIAKYKHVTSVATHSKKSLSILSNKKTVFSSSWASSSSEMEGDLYFDSPCKLLPSFHGNVSSVNLPRQGGNHSLHISFGLDKKFVIKYLSQGHDTSGLMQIVTPFHTFKNTSVNFNYVNNGAEMNLDVGVEHNKKMSAISIFGSKTDTLLVGSGTMSLPFADIFEAGFTHSLERDSLIEGISFSVGGKQILLGSVVGTYHSWKDFKLTVDVTSPIYSLITQIENQFGAEGIKTEVEAFWNGDRLSTSLVIGFHEMHLIAIASKAQKKKEIRFELSHKSKPGVHYITSLKLNSYFNWKHELNVNDFDNWENVIYLKTLESEGYISSIQNYDSVALDFSHSMVVEWNGPVITANVAYNLHDNRLVKSAKGSLTTPWSHPLVFIINLPITSTTVSPQLKLQYQKNKEITIDSLFQYENQASRFQLEVNSPHHKPININAFYDISLPTKAALISVEWDEHQVDFKATIHVDNKKCVGVIVVTRSDIDDQYFNAQFKYDLTQIHDMHGYLTVGYKHKKLGITLSGAILDQVWKGDCEITTPFTSWEKLSSSFTLDGRKSLKICTITVGRNNQIASLNSSIQLNNPLMLNAEFTGPLTSLPNLSLSSLLEINQDQHSLQLLLNSGGQEVKLAGMLHMDTDVSVVEVSVQTPITDIENLQGRASYVNKPENSSLAILLRKNQWKVQVEANSLWKGNETGEVSLTFLSPFKGLENITAILKHVLKTNPDTRILTDISLIHNDERVEIISSIAATTENLFIHVQCKTPHDNFKVLIGDLAVKHTPTKKSIDISLARNSEYVKASVVFDVKGIWNARGDLKLATPFKGYEDLSAGFDYDWDSYQRSDNLTNNLNGRAKLFLNTPFDENSFVIQLNYLPYLHKAIINATFELPQLTTVSSNIEGFVDMQEQVVFIQGQLNAHFFTLHGELKENSLNMSILTSMDGFEKLNLSSVFTLTPQKKVVQVTLEKNNVNFSISSSIMLSYLTSEIHIEGKTPINYWENFNLNAKYDLSKEKKNAIFSYERLDQYSIAAEWSGQEGKLADYSVLLSSPITGFRSVLLSIEYNLDHVFSGKALLQTDQYKVESAVLVTHKDMRVILATPVSQCRHLALIGNYGFDSAGKSVNFQIERNEDKFKFEIKLLTTKDTSELTITTPLKYFQLLSILVTHKEIPNNKNKVFGISIYKEYVNLVEISGEIELQFDSRVGFNLTATLPVLSTEQIAIGAWYTVKDSKNNVIFNLYKNSDTVVELEGNLLLTQEEGVNYVMKLAGSFLESDRHALEFELLSKNNLGKFVFSLVNYNTEDKYAIRLLFMSTSLEIRLSSPVEGYEDFSLRLLQDVDRLGIDFNSSFFYYDTLQLSSEISSLRGYNNFFIFSLGKGEEKLGIVWKFQFDTLNMKSSLVLDSHFSKYDTVNLKFDYDLRNQLKTGMFVFNGYDYKIELDGGFTMESWLSIQSFINAKTSFINVQNLMFNCSVDLDKILNKNILFWGHFNNNWEVDLQLSVENYPSVGKLTVSTVTPYNATSFTMKGSYDFVDPSRLVSVEGFFNSSDLIINTTAIIKGNLGYGEIYSLLGKNVDLYERKLIWNLKNESRHKGAKIFLELGEKDKFEVVAFMNMDGMKNLQSVFNFTDFISNHYAVTAGWSLVDKQVRGDVAVQWNKQNMTANILFMNTNTECETNIRFISPFKNFEEVVLQCKWAHGKNSKFTSLLQWKENKRVELNVFYLPSQFQVIVVTPHTSPLNFTLSHVLLRKSKLDLHTEMLASFHYGSWKNNLNLIYDIGQDIQFVLTLATPIYDVQFLQLGGSFKTREVKSEALLSLLLKEKKWKISGIVEEHDKKCDLNVTLASPHEWLKQGEILASYDLTDGYIASFSIKYNEAIVVISSAKFMPSLFALELKTPWHGLQLINIEGKLVVHGQHSQLIATAIFEDKKSELMAKVSTVSDKEVIAEIDLKTPWSKDIALYGVYMRNDSHAVKVSVHMDDHVTEMLGTGKFKVVGMSMEVELECVIEGHGSLSGKAGYNWQNPQKTAYVRVRLGEIAFNVHTQGKVDRDGITGDISINTPIDSLKLLELRVQLEKNGFIVMNINERKHQLHYTTAFSLGSFGGQMSISSPIYEIKNVQFNLMYGKNEFNFIGEMDDEKLEFLNSFYFGTFNYSLSSKFHAPIEPLRHIEFKYNLDMKKSVFSSLIQWSLREKISIESKLNAHNFHVNIKTPFENICIMDVRSQFVTKGNHNSLLGSVDWDGFRLNFDGNMQQEPLYISVHLQTEWKNNHTATLVTNLSNEKEKMTILTTGTLQEKKIDIGGEIDKVNLAAKLQVQTPLLDVPMYAEAHLSNDLWKTCEMDLQVIFPKVSYRFTVNYALTERDLTVSLNTNIPFIKMSVNMGGSYFNNNTNVETFAYINNNRVSASYELSNKVFIGSFDVNAPDLGISIQRVDIQTTTAFKPDIQASLIYRSNSYNGSMAGSLSKSSDGFSLRTDVDLPQTLGPKTHTLRLSVKYIGPQRFVEMRFDNGQSTRSGILEINTSRSDIIVSGYVTDPTIGEKKVTVKMMNNWHILAVNIFNTLHVEIKYDINSGSAVINYHGQDHKLVYHFTRDMEIFNASVGLESVLLKSGNMNLEVSSEVQEKNINAAVRCSLGLLRNEVIMNFINKDESKSLVLKFVRSSQTIVKVEIIKQIEGNFVENKASLELSNSLHNMSFRYRPSWPISIQVAASSPIIPNSSLTVEFKLDNSSLIAFAGVGNEALNQNVALKAGLDIKERRVGFEFQAPSLDLKVVSFNGVFKLSRQSIHILADGLYSSTALADIKFLTKVIVSEIGINTEIHIQSPFVALKHFTAVFQLPFKFNNHCDVKFLLILPSDFKCGAYGSMHNLQHVFEVAGGVEYNAQKIDGALKFSKNPVFSINFELNTPYKSYSHYKVHLQGQHSLMSGDDIINFVEWGDQRIELLHSTISSGAKHDYRIQLTTPFRGYERYVAGFQLELGVNKKALARLSLPNMKNEWKFEFDCRLNGVSDTRFLVDIQLPILTGFKSASLLIGSRFDAETLNYRGIVTGFYNQYEFLTSLSSTIEGTGLKVEFDTLLNENKITSQFIGGLQDSGVLTGMFEVKTPFTVLRNAKLFLKIPQFKLQNFEANISWNSKDININIFETEDKKKTIEIRNPWQSVSIEYSLYFAQDIDVLGMICWDLNNKATSIFGVGIHVNNGPENRQHIALNLKLPTREISFNHTHHHTLSIFEHSTMISWELERVVGYRVLFANDNLKQNTLIRMDLPFRAFELSSYADYTLGNVGAQLLWNAAIDRSKTMGVSLFWTPYNAELFLQHSGMNYDVSLRVEQDNFFSHNPELPSTLKLALQYSPVLQDLFSMGILYKEAKGHQRAETFVSIRHDVSNLDHSILLSTLHTAEVSTARLGIRYKKFLTGEKQTLEMHYKVIRNKPSIEAFIQDTNNIVAVKCSLQTKESDYQGFALQLTMNQKEPLRVEGYISKQEMSSELDISYGTKRGYTIKAGMPTPCLIFAGLIRNIHNLPSTDAQIMLKLNTSRLLWTQVKWNPGMLEKMQLSLLKEYNDIALVTQSIVHSFYEVFEEELTDQLITVSSAIYANSLAGLRNYTMQEISKITYDFADAVEAFALMYANNDFYLGDIHQSLIQIVSYLQQKGAGIIKQLIQMCEDLYLVLTKFGTVMYKTLSAEFTQISIFFEEVQELFASACQHVNGVFMDYKQLNKHVRSIAKRLLTTIREEIAQTEKIMERVKIAVNDFMVVTLEKCSESLQPLAITAQHYIIVLHHSVVAIKHSIIDMAETVVNTIVSIKELRELIALYNDYSTWLQGIQLQHYIESIFQYFNLIGAVLIEDFQHMFAEYKVSVDSALNVMSNQVDQIDQAPAIVYIKYTASTVYEKASWLWTYFEISAHLEMYFKGILRNLDEKVAQLLHGIDMGPQPRHSKQDLVVQHGLLEVTQHLPVDWESFQQWPEFSQLTSPSLTDTVNVKSYEDYMVSALNKLVPNFSKDTLLPPFGTIGLIAGKQHFITFDNYFYDFVGECSYLLASDFLDNKFSVVVNYESTGNSALKKSLTVISSEQRIDISANYHVSVNGKKIELPTIVGEGIVLSRVGNHLVVEIESYVTVECNLVHDVCTVQLSGWNYGKTAGLLGTYDNEPSSDIAFPNRTSTHDLARFASSWWVGNTSLCRPVNHAKSPPANDDAVDACDAYLTDVDSPLADCYSVIDPLPYYHMCISDMIQSADARGICTAAVAYASVCRKSGVEVDLPEECVQCHLSNSPTLSARDSRVVNSSLLMSADVVFVVEQASCLKDVNLTKMAIKLDSALVHQGLTDNRFSLVGFDGEMFSQPHSRTANGEIWTSAHGIEKAFAGLVLPDIVESRDEQTVYDALTFTSRLFFRGGVSKTVVLVQCNACSDGLDYGSMMGLLLQKDITLHLLEPGAITLRSGSQKTKSKVFGADLSGMYSARNGKNPKPNSEMLKQMILPVDHCSPLAFETNGTVFNLERIFSSAKQTVLSKKFVDVWSQRVAQGSQPSPCQKCECVANESGSSQVQCSKCVTASVDQYLLDWQSLFKEDSGQSGVTTSAVVDEEA